MRERGYRFNVSTFYVLADKDCNLQSFAQVDCGSQTFGEADFFIFQ